MEERSTMLMNFVLNDNKHLRRFIEMQSLFKAQKKGTKPITKPILKGVFLTFSKTIKQFRPFYLELYPNQLVRYQDKTKPPPVEQLLCQYCTIHEENEVIGEQVAFGIILQNSEENEMVKLVTDKFQVHKVWLKALSKFCKLDNFLQRFKVENRIFDHFYRCFDKKKRSYASVKIVAKKGLKPEQKKFVENEITLLRRVQCNLLPRFKKVYEDDNYIYLTFQLFQGDDLLKIVCTSSLEEIAVATLTYHILKGLRSFHNQNCFHGNLKLENIIFSTSQKENEIFVINFKFMEENSPPEYRDRLIKRGQNNYVAPEVIEGKEFGSQIDIFSLGVCLFYMLFQRFPYVKIERVGDKWTYSLDISILEQMFNEKKKDPSSHQHLSVSGIDFLLKLLNKDPDQRPTAQSALNHHWFINFTNKPTDNKKLQKFRETHQMMSLKTILECSELSEREIESQSRILFKRPFASNLSAFTERHQILEDHNANVSDEDNIVGQLMRNLDSISKPKVPSKAIRHQLSTSEYRQTLQDDDLRGNSQKHFGSLGTLPLLHHTHEVTSAEGKFTNEQTIAHMPGYMGQYPELSAHYPGSILHHLGGNLPQRSVSQDQYAQKKPIDLSLVVNNRENELGEQNYDEYIPSSPTYQSYKQRNSFGLEVIAEDNSELKQSSLKSLASTKKRPSDSQTTLNSTSAKPSRTQKSTFQSAQ